jgi:hypothetical protein
LALVCNHCAGIAGIPTCAGAEKRRRLDGKGKTDETSACPLRASLLLDPESVQPRKNRVIECEGHMITRDTSDVAPVETTEDLRKTRGLSDDELKALTRQTKSKTDAA